jgi:hypothetical protein
MSDNPTTSETFDPLAVWRSTRDAYLDTWSKTMIDLVNSEAYASATARLLDSYLTVSAPARKVMETSMAQLLAQFNMPSRAEVISLAERLTNIEMRLDDLDAKLDDVLHALRRQPHGAVLANGATARSNAHRSARGTSPEDEGL